MVSTDVAMGFIPVSLREADTITAATEKLVAMTQSQKTLSGEVLPSATYLYAKYVWIYNLCYTPCSLT